VPSLRDFGACLALTRHFRAGLSHAAASRLEFLCEAESPTAFPAYGLRFMALRKSASPDYAWGSASSLREIGEGS
jgi:hypothetical protein